MKTKEERESIKKRLLGAKKNYYCTGCGITMTVLVSLNCNCGGYIKPLPGITDGGETE